MKNNSEEKIAQEVGHELRVDHLVASTVEVATFYAVDTASLKQTYLNWSKTLYFVRHARAKEIDALLDHIAPVCLFAVSVQIKGTGVASSHGPIQPVQVKEETADSDDESQRTRPTDVKEHKEIHQFTKILTDKMAVKHVNIRTALPAYDAPGRDNRTTFRVLMWVLDSRATPAEQEVSER